jgi:S-adenosylmethionine decarboxylase proenzyme
MIRALVLFSLLFGNFLASEEPYRFKGKHFLASYLDCDLEAIGHLDALLKALDSAVAASGATILDQAHYVFPPNGLTSVHLLSESHCSIHTYPEYGACFVDLFTCGDHCSAEPFHQALQEYLKPKRVSAQLFERGEEVRELSLNKL